MNNFSKDEAYSSVLKFAKNHYENFPVVSILIKKELRKHVAIIYWFARTADDFADEGNLTATERQNKLKSCETRFNNLLKGNYQDEFDFALHSTILEKGLNPVYFSRLLIAFQQDVIKQRYNNFNEVLDYCSNSANPIGRLILELYGIKDNNAFEFSDKICTALQITNFLQDISVDIKKGRIYIPVDEMEYYKVSENEFEKNKISVNLQHIIKHQVDKTENLFNEGEGLLKYLSGKLKIEIKWTILGGREILEKIKRINFDVLTQRPALTKIDFIKLLFKSFV